MPGCSTVWSHACQRQCRASRRRLRRVSEPPPDYPYSGYPPIGYGPPTYPAYPAYQAYPAYPPPGPPAGAPPPPVYPWQPSYAPAPPYGAPQPPVRGPWAPGIIPLRPLSLSDIFNGAALYIRANPGATLGLTAVVVVTAQIISLAAFFGPLAAASRLRTAPPDQLTGGDVAAWVMSGGLAGLVGWLTGILLTGMLTVVVGRAVFGGSIGAGEAWARIRGRLPALLGLVAIEAAGLILLGGGVGMIIGVTAAAGNVGAAVLLGFPLALASIAGVLYVYVALTFAPVLIVLERMPVIAAMTRSFALVRNSFWRILGVRMLTWLVVIADRGCHRRPIRVPRSAGRRIRPPVGRRDGGGRRSGDRPDHHRAVQRRRGGPALHRPPNPRRGIRSRAANRCRPRPCGHRLERLPVADPAGVRTLK